jgi:hypothetical protein
VSRTAKSAAAPTPRTTEDSNAPRVVGPFNLEDGLAAEAEAIRTEQPVYNVQHRDPIAEQVAS